MYVQCVQKKPIMYMCTSKCYIISNKFNYCKPATIYFNKILILYSSNSIYIIKLSCFVFYL